MFCPACGTEAIDNDRFCKHCGRQLASTVGLPDLPPAVELAGNVYPLALFWRRVGAAVVDGVLWWLIYSLVVGVVLMVSSGSLVSAEPADTLSAFFKFLVPAQMALSVFSVIVQWGWESIGWSPGKLALGIRIVGGDGTRPGPLRGLVRAAGRMYSGFLAIGFLWAAWDKRHQTWHDKMADTYAIVAPKNFRYGPGGTSVPIPGAVVDERTVRPQPRAPGRQWLWALVAIPLLVAATALPLMFLGLSDTWNEQLLNDLERVGAQSASPTPTAEPSATPVATFRPLHPVPSRDGLASVPAVVGSAHTGCEAPGPRVCLLVVGDPPGVPIERIASHYSAILGTKIGVLEPIRLRADAGDDPIVDPARAQLRAGGVLHLVGLAYPRLYRDKDVTLIIVTGHDLRLEERPEWLFTFGTISMNSSGRGGWGLVSDARMDDTAYGASPNPTHLEHRLFGMIGKYVGLMYLGLQPSSDPTSPTYNSIRSVADLDGMAELEATR